MQREYDLFGKIQSIFFSGKGRRSATCGIVIFCLVFVGTFALAADKKTKDDDEAPETLEQKFIEGNIVTSQWFDSIADSIDIFLAGGKRLTKNRNETRVTMENATYVIEREPVANATSIGVNLRLPNLEHYWNVKFSNYDENKERGVKSTQLRQAPRQRNYGASVGVFRKLGDIKTSFQPRVELQSPFKISHALVFESIAEFPSYQVHPKLEFFANGDEGVGTFQGINFNFIINKKWSVAVINEGEYLDRTHMYSVTNGFSVNQVYDKKTSVSYAYFLSSNSQPNYHLDSYTLSVSWSQLIYKNVLDYQIAPNINFAKAQGFTGVPGLVFQVRLLF